MRFSIIPVLVALIIESIFAPSYSQVQDSSRVGGSPTGSPNDRTPAAVASPKGNEDELLKKADEQLEAANYKDALQLYSQVLTADPQNVLALRGRGIAKRFLGNLVGAGEDLELCLKAAPNDSWAWFQLGRLHQQQNKLESAMTDFNRSIALFEGEAAVFEQRGFVKYLWHDRDGAWTDCSHAVALDPKCASAWFILGNINLERKLYSSAANDLEQTVALTPSWADAHYDLAIAYRNQPNRKAAAIEEYTKAANLYAANGNTADQRDALTQINLMQK